MSEEYANRSARTRSPSDNETDLRSLLQSPREYERRDAALALVDCAEEGSLEPETIGTLADLLCEDDSEDVRQFAVEALGVSGVEGVADAEIAIRAALDGDDDEWVRAESVVALSRIAPDADAIADALEDDSGWVRRNAVISLGKTERATFEGLTDRIKNDPHPPVREYSALYLGKRADSDEQVEEAVRLLAAVLARDPEAFVRAKSAESLGDLATDRAEQALETHGITDRSDDVKRTAKRALASTRGVDPDQLDVDIDDGPPGGGPQAPGETPDGSSGKSSGRMSDKTPDKMPDGPGPSSGQLPNQPGNSNQR